MLPNHRRMVAHLRGKALKKKALQRLSAAFNDDFEGTAAQMRRAVEACRVRCTRVMPCAVRKVALARACACACKHRWVATNFTLPRKQATAIKDLMEWNMKRWSRAHEAFTGNSQYVKSLHEDVAAQRASATDVESKARSTVERLTQEAREQVRELLNGLGCDSASCTAPSLHCLPLVSCVSPPNRCVSFAQ